MGTAPNCGTQTGKAKTKVGVIGPCPHLIARKPLAGCHFVVDGQVVVPATYETPPLGASGKAPGGQYGQLPVLFHASDDGESVAAIVPN
jgi:hypothetical protein